MLYLFTVMEAVIIAVFFTILLRTKRSGIKAFLDIAAGTALMSLATVLISALSSGLRAMITIVLACIFCILVFKTQIYTALMITTLACYELIACDVIVANLIAIGTQSSLLSVVTPDSNIYLFLGILSKLFSFAVVFISGKILKKLDFTAPVKYSIILDIILLMMFFVNLFFAQTDTAIVTVSGHWEIIVMCVMYMAITILIFVLFFELCRYFSNETELGFSKLKNNFLEQQLAQSKNAEQNIRSFRHDMLNHLSALAYLHKKGENDRFDEYLNSITEKISVPFRNKITGIQMLDAVLDMTSRSAEEHGIKIDMKVSEVRHCPDVSENSLCSIFSNLLENAIEALGNCPEDSDRTITAEIAENAGCLNVKISNPYNSNAKKKFSASGKTHIHSGLGLGIARRTAIENGGIFEYSKNADIFTVIVMLPVSDEKITE